MALLTASTASFWPTILLCSVFSRPTSFLLSLSVSLVTGIFVHSETVTAMSSAVTVRARPPVP